MTRRDITLNVKQHSGTTRYYTVDLSRISSAGWAVSSVTAQDVGGANSDVTGTLLSGSGSVSGGTLTTPLVVTPANGSRYEVRHLLTFGGNTFTVVLKVTGDNTPIYSSQVKPTDALSHEISVGKIPVAGSWAWSSTTGYNITDPDNVVSASGQVSGSFIGTTGSDDDGVTIITSRLESFVDGETYRFDTVATNGTQTFQFDVVHVCRGIL